MKDRLLEFLKAENKSSAQFAEEIGVQPSGISHILSGRNNPSLDFVLKMLEKYDYISTDWLLFGKGTMYKDTRMQSLFDYNIPVDQNINEQSENRPTKKDIGLQSSVNDIVKPESPTRIKDKSSVIVRIIWFYDNNSFEEYFPGR